MLIWNVIRAQQRRGFVFSASSDCDPSSGTQVLHEAVRQDMGTGPQARAVRRARDVGIRPQRPILIHKWNAPRLGPQKTFRTTSKARRAATACELKLTTSKVRRTHRAFDFRDRPNTS